MPAAAVINQVVTQSKSYNITNALPNTSFSLLTHIKGRA